MCFLTEQINVALNRPAFESSSASGGPNIAVDGNTSPFYGDGSCTHTTTQPGPWWSVQLDRVYHISKVVVYNRDASGIQILNIYFNI